ncbi:MAG: hypothetical protein MRJ65_13835 [Candidatus Brocadiaceae bacterium]|nr:hypothetical protein [Candidatus Brocadiaceae bacterium]
MKTQILEEAHEEWVVIKEDMKDWIQELSHMLSENDICSRITLAPGCNTGKCGSKFILLVTKKDVHAALAHIEEYYMELHPEIRESQEWVAQGRCPACGCHVGADARECSDCGLLFIIEE